MGLVESFYEFHNANPQVYERIVEVCHALRRNGIGKYSINTILHAIRFERDLRTSGQVVACDNKPQRVKLNNNHAPYYARLVMAREPELKGFFDLRSTELDR